MKVKGEEKTQDSSPPVPPKSKKETMVEEEPRKKVQMVVYTTEGNELYGQVQELTLAEESNMRQSLQNVILEGLKYLDIDTESGWAVVPGNHVLYIEARVFGE